MLTQARLQQLLYYNRLTGVFTWRVANSNRAQAGGVAGAPHNQGYITIGVDGTRYLAHRLAWFYVHGVWPTEELDHEDTNKQHNWVSNLRLATSKDNKGNLSVNILNTSGYKGVSFDKRRGAWRSYIKKSRKQKFLGYFKTPQDAHAAYAAAAKKYFGSFARAA